MGMESKRVLLTETRETSLLPLTATSHTH